MDWISLWKHGLSEHCTDQEHKKITQELRRYNIGVAAVQEMKLCESGKRGTKTYTILYIRKEKI